MKLPKTPRTLILPALLCFGLSGCVVGAAVDLAATTVMTAGKVAVKTTGAVVKAAIPDGDKKDKKEEREKEEQSDD
ncbi:NF038104 family lipoprotein [Neisseria sp.]|uniref:NF038104 family lipoprotein n=1 Tax=Neisseria sp. TaxID=192066 RepID=UPI0035A08C39